jgi:CBS domain-containing protein
VVRLPGRQSRLAYTQDFRRTATAVAHRSIDISTIKGRAAMDYLVGDLMTIDPIVIEPGARVEEAEALMESTEVTGLPVVDEGGLLVGVISQTDLLRGGGDVNSAVRKRYTGLRVADLMSSPAITVDMTTPLVEAARLMRDERIHRVVAINQRGQPIGVLSSMDFVSLYAEGSGESAS